MEAKKDIGKAIREKLDSLDRQPNDALWGAINADLDKNKKKGFPFFWFYIVCCTFISITITAFVLSRLGSSPNITNIQPEGIQNNSAITESHNASGINTGNTTVSSVNNNTVNTTASGSKETKIENDQSGFEKTVTTTNENTKASQKNTTTETQTATAVRKQNKATKNSRRNNKQSETVTAYTEKDKLIKTKKRSKNNVSATGAVIGLSNDSKNRNQSDAGKENAFAKNNNIAQAQNSKTGSSLSETTNSNNSTANNEKDSSSIETKNIGNINTESIIDSTKVVADSLKAVTATEEKKKENEEKKKDSIPPVPYKKFSVYAYGGPSYFSFPNRTVITDSTTSDINTKSTTRFGVLFGYQLTNKLSIRTGISLYKLKQSANTIKLNYTMESTGTEIGIMPPDNFTWIDYSPWVTNGSVIDALATVSVNNYAAIINIDRELSYFEIPLEVSYNLFDRRFGINVFGGGSMLLQNKNEVFAYNENGRMFLGEWNQAKKTSFTGVLGLGLYYKISPSFQVNAEPVFNYYFDTYSDSKPYSFTFRIGLQYNFDF